MENTRRLANLMALAAVAMAPARAGDFGSPLDTMDGMIVEPKYGKLSEIEIAAALDRTAQWAEKSPPTRAGNNRANDCDRRRARNKAARKTRMQQRRRAKKG